MASSGGGSPGGARLTLPDDSPARQRERRAKWNSARKQQLADFFTTGYAGRKLDAFISDLAQAEVATLVDVRFNPVSMFNPSYNRAALCEALNAQGIEYLHMPELGVPRDIRVRAVVKGTRNAIWRWYDDHVVESFVGSNLDSFFNKFVHPVALMCVEVDPGACHRHRLALRLERYWRLRSYDL